ncbi:hypothetical protein FRC17_000341 [Serendipita sp. 399]|nr:hypothetical protein FRC17_000341 [Serendipita sp. 399]
MAQPRADDQNSDQVQRHPDLYLKDGTLVIQDMLYAPRETDPDGTDERPLILAGDSAAAWELLLGSQYGLPLVETEEYNGEQLLKTLSIAHKYCMEKIEAGIIAKLQMTSSYDGFVDIIVASQIIDSSDLYEDGLQRLIASGSPPNLPQAIRMGVKAAHTLMGAVMGESVASFRSEMDNKLKELSDKHTKDLKNANSTKLRAILED